jgi:hypothetical protein
MKGKQNIIQKTEQLGEKDEVMMNKKYLEHLKTFLFSLVVLRETVYP